MSESLNVNHRRDFLRAGTTVTAASALSTLAAPAVHAADTNTIQLALVGCVVVAPVLLATPCMLKVRR